MIRAVPEAEWPGIQLKCAAYEALHQKRASWLRSRKWEGNYLASVRTVRKKLKITTATKFISADSKHTHTKKINIGHRQVDCE